MGGFAFRDRMSGFGFDPKGEYLEYFLKKLPKSDPVFTCLALPGNKEQEEVKERAAYIEERYIK